MSSSVMEPEDEYEARFHMVPHNSIRVHECSLECWCKPQIDAEDEDIVIHNCGHGLPN